MNLKVLVDNNTLIDRYFIGEPGVSYFIEDEGTKVLFDVGYSDAFIKNANKMGVDVMDADFVVLSHGHLDHTWGLSPLISIHSHARMEGLKRKDSTIVAHPEAFDFKEFEGAGEIGCAVDERLLERHFELKLSKEPVWITERLIFLGEIERTNDFENKTPVGKVQKNGKMQDDYLLDDSALAYKSDDGLVIITGCSHAGICNIIEHAKKVCKEDRVVDIIGGFHLQDPDERQLERTAVYLRESGAVQVHACHCTDLASKVYLSRYVNVREVGVGLELEY